LVLYTNNEQIEKEYRKTIPFTIASKSQIPRNNLNKGCKCLYKENYKPLKIEIEEGYRKWNDLPCSWIVRIKIVKMAILQKSFCMFNTIPIKIPGILFITEIKNLP
jgi:hypothetical protein